MDKTMNINDLLEVAYTELKSIKESTDNKYIIKCCDIITIKLIDIEDRKFQQLDSVKYSIDSIIYDITNMKGVLEQPEEYYTKLDTLHSVVSEIPDKYM